MNEQDNSVKDEAIKHLEIALKVLSKEDDPKQWAFIHKSLGKLYMSYKETGLTQEELDASFLKTIDHFEKALTVITFENDPYTWAEMNKMIGLIIPMIASKRNDVDFNKKAIGYLKNALNYYKENIEPHEFAELNIAIGMICWKISER